MSGIVILVILLVLIAFSVKIDNKEGNDLLDISLSKYLRGVMAAVIILHHLALELEEPFSDAVINLFFISYVGFFYLLSGYGLSCSLENKEHYINRFIRDRLSKLLPPFLIAYVVRLVYECMKYGFSVNRAWIVFNKIGWYVKSIIVIYLLWFVLACLKSIFTFITINIMICLMVVMLMFYILVCLKLNLSSVWYGDIFCFAFGMILFYHKGFFEKLFKTKSIIIIVLSSFIIVVKWTYTYYLHDKIHIPGVGTILIFAASISFCLVICIASIKLKIRSSIIGGGISVYRHNLLRGLYIRRHKNNIFRFYEILKYSKYNFLYILFCVNNWDGSFGSFICKKNPCPLGRFCWWHPDIPVSYLLLP